MTTRPFVTSDGVRLTLYERGHGQNIFLFQHGLCGVANQPAEVTPALDDFRFITLECRGHGRSEAGDLKKLSISQFADDVAAVVMELGCPVILGGISMGAAISLRLAVTHPELVRALVLARPAWVTDHAPDNMRPNAYVGELLSRKSAREAEAEFMNSSVARTLEFQAPDNLQSLRGFFARTPQDITAALLSQISADGPNIELTHVKHIQVPTLVVGHEDDVIHPLAYAQELSNLIPDAELVVITSKVRDKARYVQDFQAALSQFLTRVSHA